MELTEKDRLLKVLRREKVDRPPVICPGGMMNAAVVEVMEISGHHLPEGHLDADIMAQLAGAVHEETGFDNIGMPFCMTVEAELLGSEIDYGSMQCEPKVVREKFASVTEAVLTPPGADGGKRVGIVCDAVAKVRAAYPHVPIIGNVTGPVSTAASWIDPVQFLKDLRRNSEKAHQVMAHVSRHVADLACAMVERGADVIVIADPTATGEILGPDYFAAYGIPYLNQVIARIHQKNVPVIVHICGNMNRVKTVLGDLQADGISTDAMVSLKSLKEMYPQMITMGNISTYLLEFGPKEAIEQAVDRMLDEGTDIIAPACGLSTSTSLQHIQAMTRRVKGIRK